MIPHEKSQKSRYNSLTQIAFDIILNLFITPIWTMIILGILGDCKEKMKKDIIAELRKDNHI